ncbi:MAG: DNA-directed DNA polymerase II large subunit [Halodesulfurarchaeum sp.]
MREVESAYFEELESRLQRAISIAERARENGEDPVPEVEIPVATDMADRVENILGIDGVAERVRELEDDYSRERAALMLVEDFVEGTVGDYETREGKVEGAVRTAVALLTEGVVAAPIEGIDRVELRQNDDGSEFVAVSYAGPIRSAGGTAQALSVLVADYARALLGIEAYHPREDEVERYAEEVALYDQETGLQYTPSDAEAKHIARNVPIMLDGEATGEGEVSGFRDLDRVDTNRSRGGMCLVLAEGIALKAPKIERYTDELDDVEWPWLGSLIDGDLGAETAPADGDALERAEEPEDPSTGPPRVEPSEKYLRDLIAGRPVFSHPSEPGGFRLRYGRARNHGFATAGVHPATMHLVDDFLATGTQIKTERPGKAAGVVPVDSIEGPTVKLANGDVRRIDDPAEALEVRNGVEAVLDLGEYLVNYGEFVENNQPLAPASYTVEWWKKDMAAAGANVQALEDSPYVDLANPDPEQALNWARDHDAPLHPEYTYLYHDIDCAALDELASALAEGSIDGDTLAVPRSDSVREILEVLLVTHHQSMDSLEIEDWRPLVRTMGLTTDLEREWELGDLSESAREWDNAMKAIEEVAPFAVRERAPTRIGNRMGRPEKSESRDLSPAVHTLFPIAEAGGDQRDVAKAAAAGDELDGSQGTVEVELGRRECPACGTETFRPRCPGCGEQTDPHYECPECNVRAEPDDGERVECPRCDRELSNVDRQTVDVGREFHEALASVGERETAFDIVKGVKGLMSATKVPEPMEKGILRAKHGVTAFKDGTVRYDMTDLPVTAVRPAELDVTVADFRELGYEEDINGEPLEHPDQLVELRVQDVVLSDGAAEHMLKTASFVDELLTDYYDLDPFYELEDREDLVGELVFGMAPHTSAAVVGRVVGFTSAAVGYAHPYFHASKRRNCFHPETKLWFQDETGVWHYDPIEEFVEGRLEAPREDDFGTLVEELEGQIHVPSIKADGTPSLEPISAVSKHVSTDHLLEIELETGRSLTVTPDHSMRKWDAGVCELAASQIEVGDVIPRPDTESGGATISDGSQLESWLANTGSSEVQSNFLAADGSNGPVELDEVVSVEIRESDVEHTYSVTVENTHTLLANGYHVGQCDGDEDCVMLLMDGLLNFSKKYLPDSRGGRMDAPLVMSSRIDPEEIDDEAHNMDTVREYSREFYEATREMADPGAVDVELAEDHLGTDREYSDFGFTHDTSNIALGPDLSAYKTLGSMMDKMEAQLELARKLRAVAESDVAERVIEYHFLPDLIGNLRAFTRQEVRCLSCGTKYRRVPLSGTCRNCGGNVNLTVHEGSVTKYLETAIEVAEEYGSREYTKQRLRILERSIDSIFENDKNKQSGIADFM